MQDTHGLPLTCASAEAAQAYAQAVDAQLHAWPGIGPALDEALRAAPDFALAHALRALHAATYARRAEVGPAIQLAQQHAAQASEREQSHVAVIALAVTGQSAAALEAALAHAQRWPTDALVAATLLGAFGLLAFSGRADHDAARLALVRQLRPHYPADHPWLLAHLGWACIEAGQVEEGVEHAQRSFALRPANGNIAHVLMHGHFERHDPAAALAFIDGWLPSYPEEALLFGHLHWHAALCEIDLGRPDAALARFTQQVLRQLDLAPPLVGMTDASSLLWRLRGLAQGGLPWPAVGAHATHHFSAGGNVFAEVHLAALAAAQSDRAALDAVASRLRVAADKGHAGAPAGLRWAAGLAALMNGDTVAARSHMEACLADAVRLGGSHAQRTIVDRTLAAMAEAA